MHQAGPMQDTPLKDTLVNPEGFGLATADHAVPFHCSIRPLSPPPPLPTAVHVVDEVHETAWRYPPPTGSGVVSRLQVAPFELKATGAYTLLPK